MKKSAQKDVRSVKKHTKKPEAKVVVPPDILGDRMSNEIPDESVPVAAQDKIDETKKSPIVSSPETVTSEGKVEQPTFYEKVTGEKLLQKPVPEVDPNAPLEFENNPQDERLPQIEKLNKKLFFLGGAVFLLTIVITTLIGLLIINTTNVSKESNVVEKVRSEITPTIVPPISIDKSQWTFEVLNGSGEGGKGKKTADAIESLGYTVENTGNANNSDYKGVQVTFVSEIENAVKDVILKDLNKEFLSVEENNDKTEETDSSILIIVGK